MTVEQLVPARGLVEIGSVLDALDDGPGLAEPFADSTLAFFVDVGRRLSAHPSSAAMPDLRALAFWMRPAGLHALKEQFDSTLVPGTVRLPRGRVFHLPPANVDTIFMYSWLLATLCGNQGVVRLSAQRGAAATAVCDVMNDVLGAPGAGRHVPGVAVVTYGHEAAVTAAISARADVRVVWGGDATVARIREIPIPPRAVELTFADRYSLAAIDAHAYRRADPRRRSRLAEDFVGDTFQFDQAACSSPQLVVWRGSDEDVAEARDAFFSEVAAAAARRGYSVDASVASAQTLASAGLAIDRSVLGCRRFGRELLVVEIGGPDDIVRDTVGGGYLLSLRVAALDELVPYLTKADQTVTQFGFGEDELREFARRAGARGAIDRIVPIGQALAFDGVWDGYDLLGAFTRTVRVTAAPGVASAQGG